MQRATFRIIDANFNRAAEAARMIEEFCRFALNSSPLSARIKQLRHELCSAVAELNADKLICSRDTIADVGCSMAVDNQLSRTDLDSCLKAARKRLTEALRVLAETTQTVNPAVAEKLEKLRYDAYTLEKDIIVFSDTAVRYASVRLYAIITAASAGSAIALAKTCAASGADCIQLRMKDCPDSQLLNLAEKFVAVCTDAGVISIINDRVDIAVCCQADGVHLGQDDLSVAQARQLQMKPLIIGKSTHSIAELNNAIAQEPTYVGLGAVFTTDTKKNVRLAGTEYLKQAIELLNPTGIGHAAIGGITIDNIDDVLKAGAKTVAVSSALAKAADPAELCTKLKAKIIAYKVT